MDKRERGEKREKLWIKGREERKRGKKEGEGRRRKEGEGRRRKGGRDYFDKAVDAVTSAAAILSNNSNRAHSL